jgi:periplasmic protein TonB
MLFYEPKKTEWADLENKRVLFFSIALFITMSLVVLAFEVRQFEKEKIDLQVSNLTRLEETIEIPPTEIPPPPPPTVVQPQIIEVPNEEVIKDEVKVEFDVEVTEQTKVQEFTVFEQPVVEKEDTDEIFLVVEHTAVPKGGMEGFYKFVNSRLRYPAQARRMNIEGRVFIEFVVDKDGTITDVKAIKGIGAGCDEEAIRVVESSPPWLPGRQRGRPVKQRMVLPIIFKLAGNT